MSFKAILAFEDGSVFYGKGFGKEKFDVGELVFNTSMTGYQEIIPTHHIKNKLLHSLTLILEILELIMKIMSQILFMRLELLLKIFVRNQVIGGHLAH